MIPSVVAPIKDHIPYALIMMHAEAETRKSIRQGKQPIWMKDYVTKANPKLHCCLYPLSDYLSYANTSVKYQLYLASFSLLVEPQSFKEAAKDARFKANGEVERFKARLVAKGYSQREGLDYHDIFSPMAKMVKVRSIIALEASNGWDLFQMGVYNAFLQDYHDSFSVYTNIGTQCS
ncbi:uncharacterized protein [Nicotiana tomentosiformis]|uniref:uncharacterized protein n=1 Tax=Nicotiana tomentosiformis TaxID=4098 RepID=UPI00388C3A47